MYYPDCDECHICDGNGLDPKKIDGDEFLRSMHSVTRRISSGSIEVVSKWICPRIGQPIGYLFKTPEGEYEAVSAIQFLIPVEVQYAG
jgi:hypothetical protein